MQPGLPLHGDLLMMFCTNQMGLRSSIDCPTSSTQSIFMAQSKGMHQVTNILLHFNQQSTSNVMHVFLVSKEGDGSQKLNQLLIFIQCNATLQLSQYLWPNQKVCKPTHC
ncbi:unnamed protein product [Musa hybrid cultivar]